MTKLGIFATGVTATVGVYCAAVLMVQRSFFYQPPAENLPVPDGCEPVQVGPGGRTHGFFFDHTADASRSDTPHQKRRVVLFAHGNGSLSRHFTTEAFEPLLTAGFDVFSVEYPGYDSSPGKPTQKTISASMEDAYLWLLGHAQYDESDIILFGQSLGGGAVATLLDQYRPGAIVLWETFSSMAALVRSRGVPRLLVLDPYDTNAALRNYSGTVVIMHSSVDQLIPPAHAEANAKVAGTQVFWNSFAHGVYVLEPFADMVSLLATAEEGHR